MAFLLHLQVNTTCWVYFQIVYEKQTNLYAEIPPIKYHKYSLCCLCEKLISMKMANEMKTEIKRNF